MSDDKRKNARTQGRFSGGDREITSRRPDKQNSKMPSADKNKGEKRKAPTVGSRAQNEMDLQYDEKSSRSFKELEPVKKPQELRFHEPLQNLSETENGISRLLYDPDFMKFTEAEEYMTILKNSTTWYDKKIVIRGVEYPQPRLVAWYGPHPYTYAGATLEAKEMPTTILEIKGKVEERLRQSEIDVELNSVLLNYYRNEKDSVAWHSDDEFALGVCPTIASVSLGATRKFEMRPKGHVPGYDMSDVLYVNLTHGSLIVMDGCMQKDWQHRVPKGYHDTAARINLTFRTIYPIDQLPPEIPHMSKMKFSRSPTTKVAEQQSPKFDTESFPPLGMEMSDKKGKVLPKGNGSKDFYQQKPSGQRKLKKEENWDGEMFPSLESAEPPKIQNNLNKKSNHDPVIDSPEMQPSQTDYNLNVKESTKLHNIKVSPNEFRVSEYHSNNSETFQSDNFESNEMHELESERRSPSESKSFQIEEGSVESNAKTADSEKKYILNAEAPEYVPQNKFEKYSLSELAKYCKNSQDVKNEDLSSFTEALFKCLYKEESPFITRDLYELEVYYKLNDGSLSDAHLRIILERISSMITNAFYKKNDSRYGRYQNRSYDENYRKPRQTYTQSRRY